MSVVTYRIITIAASMLLATSCDRPYTGDPAETRHVCAWNGTDELIWLDSIACPEEFEALAGPPLMQTFSNVRSVKTVHEIATGRTYFVSRAYELHYDFCKAHLGYPWDHARFNDEQYGTGSGRLYYLASINLYKESGIFALQFFSDDRIDAEGIATAYRTVKDFCYFGESLRFLVNSTTLGSQAKLVPGLPLISEDELYAEQEFQALNCAEAYGFLRKVDLREIERTYLGRHDVVVVNGLPLDIPVIAGIVTTVFQTPLSHVNVLSHNRGTPNMALKTAWTDELIAALENRLVRLEVTADSFFLEEAGPEAAEEFWRLHEPSEPETLLCHDDTAGLFDMSALTKQSLHLVGAKAANLAFLSRIVVDGLPMPVPEGAFAIPFNYYRSHMRDNGLENLLAAMLDDSLFASDAAYRESQLEKLRRKIIEAPLDAELTAAVAEKIRSSGGYSAIRFRSSTNVEDIEGFNGAGLYESYTAHTGEDGAARISEAIKKVYAGLWTLRGFEEREYFMVDQHSCAMGILVHRAFPDEQANGVAITANIYEPYVPAFTINAQIKDISVVRPPSGFLSDQLLVYTIWDDWQTYPSVEYISHSNINNGRPVLTETEVLSLARCLAGIKDGFFMESGSMDYYSFAMDVEFKFDGPGRKLYIKQARPYTISGE